MAKKAVAAKATSTVKRTKASARVRCGLCGSTRKKLTVTDCCRNFICDDEHRYVLFSYDDNSCYRNHDRYTVCGYHFHEGHSGNWKECQQCQSDFDEFDYVDMGTNEYNFDPLKIESELPPTHCCECNTVIVKSLDWNSERVGELLCSSCSEKARELAKAKPSLQVIQQQQSSS